jgi:hypothetical protein
MPLDLLHRAAAARPATFDAEALSVEAVVATSTPVPRRDAAGPYLEILDVNGVDLARMEGISVLDSHRQDGLARILGRVTQARVEGNELVVRIAFSRRPDVAPFIEDIREGTIRHLSIGYTVEAWREGREAAA